MNTGMTLREILRFNELSDMRGHDCVYSNVLTGLTVVWDGGTEFAVYRNVGTVNDSRFMPVATFRGVARDSLQASDRAIAFANSRNGKALWRGVPA